MKSSTRAAFSLVEVLMAIVVLSLGLLGLAAVFPVVVHQQRQASDTVQGSSLERSAAEAMRSYAALQRPSVGGSLAVAANRRGWDRLICNENWSPRGEWVIDADDAGQPIEYLPSGEVRVDVGMAQPLILSPMERLMPRGIEVAPAQAANSGPVVLPRYVWDVVTRRVDAGETNPASLSAVTGEHYDDLVQVAMFIRRLDAGIRASGVPLSYRVRQAVQGGAPYATLPVACDATSGVPTGNGRGVYSQVLRFDYRIVAGDASRTRIEVDVNNSLSIEMRTYASQAGQWFVDDIGGVHRVTKITPGAAGAPAVATLDTPISPEMEASTLAPYSMLFTPQSPAGVVVRTLSRTQGY